MQKSIYLSEEAPSFTSFVSFLPPVLSFLSPRRANFRSIRSLIHQKNIDCIMINDQRRDRRYRTFFLDPKRSPSGHAWTSKLASPWAMLLLTVNCSTIRCTNVILHSDINYIDNCKLKASISSLPEQTRSRANGTNGYELRITHASRSDGPL